MEGTAQEAGTVLWERQADRMQGSHVGSVHSEARQKRQQSSETLLTNRREEEVEKYKRGSEGADRKGEGWDKAEAQAMQDA